MFGFLFVRVWVSHLNWMATACSRFPHRHLNLSHSLPFWCYLLSSNSNIQFRCCHSFCLYDCYVGYVSGSFIRCKYTVVWLINLITFNIWLGALLLFTVVSVWYPLYQAFDLLIFTICLWYCSIHYWIFITWQFVYIIDIFWMQLMCIHMPCLLSLVGFLLVVWHKTVINAHIDVFTHCCFCFVQEQVGGSVIVFWLYYFHFIVYHFQDTMRHTYASVLHYGIVPIRNNRQSLDYLA